MDSLCVGLWDLDLFNPKPVVSEKNLFETAEEMAAATERF